MIPAADLLGIDIKSLASFRKVCHRIPGNRQQEHCYGVGYDKVHVIADEATRHADLEMLANEHTLTVIGRAIAWFNS